MGVEDHHLEAAEQPPIPVALIITTDSRTEATDESGKLARELLEAAGCRVVSHEFAANDPHATRAAVEKALGRGARVVILSGGTGIGRRDLTVETVSAMSEKRLEGFGELFRMLSFKDIGAAAMLSRAFLGVKDGKILVCLPGSPKAVRLALEKLLIPELKHLLKQTER